MHAFLLSGGTREARLELIERRLKSWQVGKFDRLNLAPEVTSIGIRQVREMIGQLNLKPATSPYLVAIIHQAESLTLEAQQALLKTLEEPPAQARLILETDNPATLLPTIVSRCQTISLSASGGEKPISADTVANTDTLLSLLETPKIGERLKIIDQITTKREVTLRWVEEITMILQKELSASKSKFNLTTQQTAKILRLLLEARQQLLSNVNPKLILDNVFSQI